MDSPKDLGQQTAEVLIIFDTGNGPTNPGSQLSGDSTKGQIPGRQPDWRGLPVPFVSMYSRFLWSVQAKNGFSAPFNQCLHSSNAMLSLLSLGKTLGTFEAPSRWWAGATPSPLCPWQSPSSVFQHYISQKRNCIPVKFTLLSLHKQLILQSTTTLQDPPYMLHMLLRRL